MWHDGWPPVPPGGHRPPDAPPFTSPGDQLLAVGLGATAGAGALVWATGQLAGLAFGHTWLNVSPADVPHILWHLPQHWSDPHLAWPAQVRGPLPGPAGMYASFAGVVGALSGGTAAVLRHLPGRAAGDRPEAGAARRHATSDSPPAMLLTPWRPVRWAARRARYSSWWALIRSRRAA